MGAERGSRHLPQPPALTKSQGHGVSVSHERPNQDILAWKYPRPMLENPSQWCGSPLGDDLDIVAHLPAHIGTR